VRRGRDDDERCGGGCWIFRTADLVVRRNRGCVVLLVTLRITCACGRGPRDTCARRPVPSCRPLIPCALDGSVTKCVSGQAPGLPGPRLAKNGVACYGWPRPDAARGPGVVSADSCGPGERVGGHQGAVIRARGSFFRRGTYRDAAPSEGCPLFNGIQLIELYRRE
jgi:hypothetical protein